MTTAVRARPDKSSPTMQLQVKHAPKRIPLNGIKDIARSASDMLVDVRESMLAPHPRKNPPVFTTAQVGLIASVCII
jgi:chromosome partitioning protein